MSSTVGLSRNVEIRDSRLHTVLTYHGDAVTINEKGKKEELKPGNFCFGQCGNCQEGCAVGMVCEILDTAMVVHSPIGCYASQSAMWIGGRNTAKGRNKGEFEFTNICTNIQEKDTIYGAGEKLRVAIQTAYDKYQPQAIFVTTSCASGIIGDDVPSIVDEMEEKLGIPVVDIACEGFKSRIWSTGFDTSFKRIADRVIKPPKKKRNMVNVFNFAGVDNFSRLLNPIGLTVNFLPAQASLQEFSEISEAVCTATICQTLATYIGDRLEKEFGVPQVRAAAPYGLDWTDNWLRAVAKIAGKEEEAEAFIESEHKRIAEPLAALRKYFEGKTAYVFSGDSYAHNIASVASDLGLKIIGVTTYHHDQQYDTPEINTLNYLVEKLGNVPNYSVCNKQPYQVVKFLQRLNPDVLIVRHAGLSTFGYKLGIPTIVEGDSNKCVGYDGLIELGYRIQRVFQTRKLIKNISEYTELPYTEWWLDEKTDPFYFVEGA